MGVKGQREREGWRKKREIAGKKKRGFSSVSRLITGSAGMDFQGGKSNFNFYSLPTSLLILVLFQSLHFHRSNLQKKRDLHIDFQVELLLL